MTRTMMAVRRPGVWTPVEVDPPFRGVLVDGLIPEWDDRVDPDAIVRDMEWGD